MHYNDIRNKELKSQIDLAVIEYHYNFKFFDPHTLENLSLIKIEGEEVVINVLEDSLNILFDGSSDIKEWLDNLKVFKKKSDDITDNKKVKFHKGFYETFKSILPEIRKRIIENDIKTVDITGFSRGGFLGVLLYRHIRKHMPHIKLTGTGFGVPCGMNEAAAIDCCRNKYLEGFVIVEHYQDAVSNALRNRLGYVGTPCTKVLIGSNWARRLRFIKRVSPHLKYFKDGSY